MGAGKKFSDDLNVVEDIKKSLSFSVEITSVGETFGQVIGSISLIRKRVTDSKRIYRELSDMGLERLSDLDPKNMKVLRKRLSQPEVLSLKYEEKISDYFDGIDPQDIPFVNEGKRRGYRIDRQAVYLELGLEPDVGKLSQKVRSLFAAATVSMQEVHPVLNFIVGDVSESKGAYTTGDSYAKQYSDLLAILQTFYRQSDIPGMFNYPLTVDPLSSREIDHYVSQYLPEQRAGNRTRNIPVEAWMPIMDAAVRWVVDYAEPLKQAETEATEVFRDLERLQGRHAAGRQAGLYLRSKTFRDGKHSPFPLSAYAQYTDNSHKVIWTEDALDAISDELEAGVSPGDVQKRWGITKPQFDYVRKKLATRHIGNGSGLSLQKARYGFLPLCCTLILLAFTAGRETSIATLKAGCIRRKFGDLYINMFIPKTLRRYDDLPTVELVEKAISVLEELSESAREESGDDKLYQFKGVGQSSIQGFRWESHIDDFLDWIGVEAEKDGEKFKFSEHQFRRFFAMMFFYRYDSKFKLNALLRFLRHLDWGMTSVYITEKSAGLVLKEIAAERAAEFAVAAANDEAGGNMANEFKKMIGQSLRIKTEKQQKLFLRKVKEGSFVWDFCVDGVCFGRTPGRECLSACKLESEGEVHVMIHKQQHKGACEGCPNLLTTNEIKWDKVEEPKASLMLPGLKAAVGA